jgi:Leucine-rich repeat (LRR) protein
VLPQALAQCTSCYPYGVYCEGDCSCAARRYCGTTCTQPMQPGCRLLGCFQWGWSDPNNDMRYTWIDISGYRQTKWQCPVASCGYDCYFYVSLDTMELTRNECDAAACSGTLNLRAQSIIRVSPTVFQGMSGVKEIDLSVNLISHLPSEFFDGMVSLQTLKLNNNGISYFPADLFKDFASSLQYLDMSSNYHSWSSADSFRGLTSLTHLALSSNSISELPRGIFRSLTLLRTLHLNDNLLQSLPADIFQGLVSLEHL